MESPPKRMTRSRAAAKATEPPVKTTKIVTAAARARTVSTATASTKSTAAKRKTRADEDEVDGADEQSAAKRPARGRPRKVVEELPAAAPTKASRGRAAKKVVIEAPVEEPAPPRATRGRPKKTTEAKPAEEIAQEAPKKATRGRAATTSKPAPTVTAAKPTVKKTVKFQEPDKENVEPSTKAKEPTTSGLRGRPVRRAAATGARTTRAVTKGSDEAEKKPLSPKKVTQIPVSRDRDDSEDELAAEEKTPFMALMKSPIKPPSTATIKGKQLEVAATEEEEETTAVINAAILDPPDLTATALGSPARRPPASPFKDTLKSPARKMGAVTLPGSAIKCANTNAAQPGQSSPFKASLLNSPAKRPQSPIKGLNFASVTKPQQSQSTMKMSMFQSPAKRAMPGFRPLTEPRRPDSSTLNDSPLPKLLIASTATSSNGRPSEKLILEDESANNDEAVFSGSIEELQFPGRLSAVLPRHADPALQEDTVVAIAGGELESEALIDQASVADECIAPALVAGEHSQQAETPLNSEQSEIIVANSESAEILVELSPLKDTASTVTTDSPQTKHQAKNPMFQLRPKDLSSGHEDDYDTDENLTGAINVHPATPTSVIRKTSPSKSNRSAQNTSKNSRRSTMGFTLLTEQFSAWSAASPSKESLGAGINATGEGPAAALPVADSPLSAPHFFDDEMLVRPDLVADDGASDVDEKNTEDIEIEEPSFDDVLVTDEDVALAVEADEMSVLEPQEIEEITQHSQSFDDSLSDASQEYGDENQVPIDPAMLGQANQGPSTPVRPMKMSFHTTTKVPLKPADNSTPSPLKKRSFSASRIAPKRPSVLSRSATVISYSLAKESKKDSVSQAPATPTPVTPSKKDIWSTLGTPARTPRRDIDSSLLRGAIVHVDVYTSDGTDASGIFVELLGQMGARCVKTWDWNPSDAGNGETSSAKVGITHVVYKDGGKKTLEKVRLAKGIVHCVGVSWVLDCERENEWLDEGPYTINTRIATHGGGSRRKTMEPTALTNLNETSLSIQTKGQGSSRGIKSAPNTPLNRRDSTVWMHTPSDQDTEDVSENDMAWPTAVLTPVPKTPAPETIARYVADMPDTPSVGEDELDESPTKQSLLMRTCPPKSKYQDLGDGLLSKDKDEQVLMRLMAARRKSLQFAPKIGSPLARTWA